MHDSLRRIGLTTTLATMLVVTTIALPALADPYSAEVGVSEDAEGTVAASVGGDAEGEKAAVATLGNATCTGDWACAAVNTGHPTRPFIDGNPILAPYDGGGDAEGGAVGVSAAGNASCQSPCVAAAPIGTASCEEGGEGITGDACVAVGNETEGSGLVMVGKCEGAALAETVQVERKGPCWIGW